MKSGSIKIVAGAGLVVVAMIGGLGLAVNSLSHGGAGSSDAQGESGSAGHRLAILQTQRENLALQVKNAATDMDLAASKVQLAQANLEELQAEEYQVSEAQNHVEMNSPEMVSNRDRLVQLIRFEVPKAKLAVKNAQAELDQAKARVEIAQNELKKCDHEMALLTGTTTP